MVKTMNWNWKRIDTVADIERAKKGKKYKKGSTLIPLSACVRSPLLFLENSGIVDEKYLVVEPKECILPEYLFLSVSQEWEHFKSIYIQNINIKFEDFKHFKIKYCSLEEQEETLKCVKTFDDDIKRSQEVLEKWKMIKKHMLKYLFVE